MHSLDYIRMVAEDLTDRGVAVRNVRLTKTSILVEHEYGQPAFTEPAVRSEYLWGIPAASERAQEEDLVLEYAYLVNMMATAYSLGRMQYTIPLIDDREETQND